MTKKSDPKGEMLSDNQRVFRVKVLKTGVPLHKMEYNTRRRRLPSHIGAPHATADSICKKRRGRKTQGLLLSLMGQRGLEKHWLL